MEWTKLAIAMCLMIFSVSAVAAQTLIDPAQAGFDGKTRGENYDQLVNSLLAGGAVDVIDNDKLWVPWFSSSSHTDDSYLKGGNACDAGVIDREHNCMVTDEFSQVGLLVSMGKDQTRMNQFYNTVKAISSTNDDIPAWRVYRNGNVIEQCKEGINGNCDTASDATARIIMALFTAAHNDDFQDSAMKQEYRILARTLSDQFIDFELEKTCRETRHGTTCHWLASGSETKRAGISAWDFTYSGYFGDAIIAMLFAHADTGNQKYMGVAEDLTRNYLQAARYDGNSFSVPPGRSFRWEMRNGMPEAACTGGSCNPPMWDQADAPRAVSVCTAEYYAGLMGKNLPMLDKYCSQWKNEHMSNPDAAPIQFFQNGDAAVSPQSGYYAQGLQALMLSNQEPALFRKVLDNALSHYTPSKGTWDWAPAFGVYHQAFPMRALGIGLGRNLGIFGQSADSGSDGSADNGGNNEGENDNGDSDSGSGDTSVTGTGRMEDGIAGLRASLEIEGGSSVLKDETSGTCRTIEWSTSKGNIKVLTCEKSGGFVEVYRQSHPSDAAFKACAGSGCVNQYAGFARFKPIPEDYAGTGSSPDSGNSDSGGTGSGSSDTNDSGTDGSDTGNTDGETTVVPKEGIGGLKARLEFQGSSQLKSDVTSGTCRTVQWSTSRGDIKVMACEKSGKIEVYRQAYPANVDFKSCIGSGCVDRYGGWTSFTPVDRDYVTETTQDNGGPGSTDDATDTGGSGTGSDQEPAEWTYSGIPSLPARLEINGGSSVKADTTSGTCRTVIWGTSHGDVKVFSCEKPGGFVEVYRQAYPANVDFKACLGDGCVNRHGGWARFQP